MKKLLLSSLTVLLGTSFLSMQAAEKPESIQGSLSGVKSTAPQITAKKNEFWIYNGDPELAQKYPRDNFGLVKGELFYPEGLNQNPGLLENNWFKLDSSVAQAILPYSRTWFATDTYSFNQKHAVGVFATVSHAVVQEYNDRQDLLRLLSRKQVAFDSLSAFQRRDNDQTVIYPDAGVEKNAYYMPPWSGSPSKLMFFHFTGNKGENILTGASSDVANHEAGHKRHRDLRPNDFNMMDDSTPRGLELGAFSEAFGDTYSLLWSIRDSKQRKRAFEQVGLNFHNKDNILSNLGEQFGTGLGLKTGIRDLDDNVIYGKAPREVHDMGLIWAGGWYDVFASAHEYALASYMKSGLSLQDAQEKAAVMCGTYLARLNVLSTLLVNDPQPGFSHFLAKILEITQEHWPLTGDAAVDNADWDLPFIMHMTAVRKIDKNVQGRSALGIVPNYSGKPGCAGVIHRHND